MGGKGEARELSRIFSAEKARGPKPQHPNRGSTGLALNMNSSHSLTLEMTFPKSHSGCCLSCHHPGCGAPKLTTTKHLPYDCIAKTGDRVLGEGEKDSFIALPGKWGHSGLMP